MSNKTRKTTVRLPTPHHFGKWEWVALPEFGISCMKARLSSKPGRSTLESEDWTHIDLDGLPGVCFRVYPLIDDPQTFVLSAAPFGDSASAKDRAMIRTSLILGGQKKTIELMLIPRRGEPSPLTLRLDVLGGATSIDPDAECLAGLPQDRHLSNHRETAL